MLHKKKQPLRADTTGMLEFFPVTFDAAKGRFRPLFPNRATVWIDPVRGCFVWGKALREGYGAIKIGPKVIGAHVVSWERANGAPVGYKRVICHSCDVRCCVNPEHLSNGTYRENTMDALAKGRMKHPPNRWVLAKLRAEQAA